VKWITVVIIVKLQYIEWSNPKPTIVYCRRNLTRDNVNQYLCSGALRRLSFLAGFNIIPWLLLSMSIIKWKILQLTPSKRVLKKLTVALLVSVPSLKRHVHSTCSYVSLWDPFSCPLIYIQVSPNGFLPLGRQSFYTFITSLMCIAHCVHFTRFGFNKLIFSDKSTNYEAPNFAVFCSVSLLPPS
jgi:hypothetical protein